MPDKKEGRKANAANRAKRNKEKTPEKIESDETFSEQRLYVINRSGTGDVSYLLVKENFSAILSYHVHTEKWCYTVNLVDFGVVTLGRFIYVVGGFNQSEHRCTNNVMRYDPKDVTWSECASLSTARCKFGICVAREKIYVCGGEKDGSKTIASCEMFDPKVNSWTECGRLPEPRSSCSCAADGNAILCAGGFYKGQGRDNFWIYERREWQEMDKHYPLRLPYCLYKSTVAHAQNAFYFVGGVSSKVQKGMNIDGEEMAVDLEYTERKIFSYTSHVSAKYGSKGQQLDLILPWSYKLPPMFYARQNHGVVTLGQNIYVIGGSTVETGDPVTIAERMDLVRGEWFQDFTLENFDVSNVCCVVMEVPKVPMSERKIIQNRLKWVMW